MEENDEVKQVCYLKETQLQDMQNDLDVLTREHQNLTQQIMVVQEENDGLKKEKNELEKKISQAKTELDEEMAKHQ